MTSEVIDVCSPFAEGGWEKKEESAWPQKGSRDLWELDMPRVLAVGVRRPRLLQWHLGRRKGR